MFDEVTELPEGWTITNLGELGEWSSGGTPSRTHAEYYGGDIPWVKTGNLPDGLITEIDESITLEGLTNSSAKLFPSGSLIVAKADAMHTRMVDEGYRSPLSYENGISEFIRYRNR